MIEYDFDIDGAETTRLRKLYASSCEERGVECRRVNKMGRNELLKKIRELIRSGDLGRPRDPEEPEMEVPDDGVLGIRHPLKDPVEACFRDLLESVRLYLRHDLWCAQGRSSDPQAHKYLSDARECVRRAVVAAIDANGSGWDRASKLMYCVDRALLKMRTDFNETLAANCVMEALLSDEHQARMEKARG